MQSLAVRHSARPRVGRPVLSLDHAARRSRAVVNAIRFMMRMGMPV